MKHLGWMTIALMAACSGDEGTKSTGDTAAMTGMTPTTNTSDDQTPPQGAAAVDAWLADGAYLGWTCEPAAHAGRSPSPHGFNRICSNDLLAHAGPGEYPVGAASVKELFADDGATLVGYAVALHTTAGTEGGDWYWYEKVPLDSAAPHDADGVVADGLGDSGPAQSICVSCHAAAGADADHSGHDFVYTQVM